MKYLKLQQDILKACDRQWKKPITHDYFYSETEDEVIVLISSAYAMIVPKAEWWLDLKAIFGEVAGRFDRIKDMIRKAEDVSEVLEDPHVTEEIERNGKVMKLKKLTLGSEVIWLDEALLKYLDLPNTGFKGSNGKSPVLAYEGTQLVGLFLPVHRNKKEEE